MAIFIVPNFWPFVILLEMFIKKIINIFLKFNLIMHSKVPNIILALCLRNFTFDTSFADVGRHICNILGIDMFKEAMFK